jgi:aminodeoxyfutalosine synthase
VARLTIGEVPQRPWSDVCRQVAALQRKLQAFRSFAPLPRTLNLSQPTTGYEDVKRIALSRLLAEGVDTIQVDWALYGPKLAQVALTFGANDLDSVSAIEDQAKGPRRTPAEEVQRSIRSAGFEPVVRDAWFETI